MKSPNTARVREYLEAHARPLDLALYSFHFNSGTIQNVLNALVAYQNSDGGFGNAIEPDLRLPHSTAIGTWTALQVLNEIEVPRENKVLERALSYLLNTYDSSLPGWAIIRPEADTYPHAPWWNYESAINSFGWGNPSAELLGFLIKYKDVANSEAIVPQLKAKALARIHEVNPENFHEVFNFEALYLLGDTELKEALRVPLTTLIQKSASTSQSEWTGYVAPPLKFVSSPNDPFCHLFSKDLVDANLNFLLDTVVTENHWEPNWSWFETYPEAWEQAKKEWAGNLTVKNMVLLKNFGVR